MFHPGIRRLFVIAWNSISNIQKYTPTNFHISSVVVIYLQKPSLNHNRYEIETRKND